MQIFFRNHRIPPLYDGFPCKYANRRRDLCKISPPLIVSLYAAETEELLPVALVKVLHAVADADLKLIDQSLGAQLGVAVGIQPHHGQAR